MSVLDLDHGLFQFINAGLSNWFFDFLMPVITDLHQQWWVYFLLILVSIQLIRKKKLWVFNVATVCLLTVGASDFIAYRLVKKSVDRQRPEFVLNEVTLRSPSHGGRSFPSNHASNSFAAAIFLALMFKRY